MGVFQKLNDEGKTVVLITHEADIAEHARRIVVLPGRTARRGPARAEPPPCGAETVKGSDAEVPDDPQGRA